MIQDICVAAILVSKITALGWGVLTYPQPPTTKTGASSLTRSSISMSRFNQKGKLEHDCLFRFSQKGHVECSIGRRKHLSMRVTTHRQVLWHSYSNEYYLQHSTVVFRSTFLNSIIIEVAGCSSIESELLVHVLVGRSEGRAAFRL